MELRGLWSRAIFGPIRLCSKNPFALGYGFCFGLGSSKVEKNKAFTLFEVSAKEGDEYGQSWLGACYYYGYGIEVNYEKSLYWYWKSAEQGLADSQYYVGCMYHNGDGCDKNKEVALMWFKKAIKQGNEHALEVVNN